jgi:hypothetical protein
MERLIDNGDSNLPRLCMQVVLQGGERVCP